MNIFFQCDIIASLGLQVGGVCVTKDKVPSYFGTPKAMSFFKDNIIEIVDSLTGILIYCTLV